ncbi:MAG: S8 family serine peptidase [Bacteroidales bacterium]|nr:S8 family serine peptidase [Bacteroidales bacterium]
MKKIYKGLILALASAGIAGCTGKGYISADEPGNDGPVVVNESVAAIDGEIIVKLKDSASAIVTRAGVPAGRSGIDQIDRVLTELGTVKFERLFPECGRFEERTRKEGLHLWYIAEYDPSVPTAQVASLLSACKDIDIIEYSLPTVSAEYSSAELPCEPLMASASAGRTAHFPFNEGSRAQMLQWHYNNTGTVGAVNTVMGADANVWKAWELCTGNPDVIVAVIDQGVKYDHEDLAANMWVNKDEIPGNGIDDDGNGYVDDIYGYNFVDGSGMITFSADNMHGTHVAGTVSAVNNNGIGVNGIAGGSGKGDGVKIMTLQTLGASESGSSGAGIGGQVRAMKYAADNGAVISQNSWGYTAGAISATNWKRGVYSALSRAMEYFVKYAGIDENGNQVGPMAGGIVIFAAGNDNSDELNYPASDPAAVNVASISYLGTPANYTNYGTWVSMSAPGGDLALNSTYGGVYSTSVAEDGSSAYESIQGTSMACPHVSGACALAVSYYYGAEKRKGLTSEMLRQALLSSTRPMDSYYPASHAGLMGTGVLDTYSLLKTVVRMADIPAVTVRAGSSVSVDLSEYFPSVQVLVYSVSANGYADISLAEGVMTIKGVSKGTVTVKVSDGTAIEKTFDVTVE